jgi:hypothetical protein
LTNFPTTTKDVMILLKLVDRVWKRYLSN